MLLRTAALALAVTACAEPVVELQIELPSNVDSFDASCISAVEIYVSGGNVQNDPFDFTRSCVEITSQQRLGGVRDAIRGKFNVTLPDTGIAGVEIVGLSGPQPCAPPENVSGDLIFHGSAPYIGQDSLVVKLDTTLDCARTNVKIRPVEVFTLVSGATPSATATNCTAAAVPAGTDMGYGSLGTILERPFSAGVDFWGGFRWADLTAGVASFSASTTGANKSCIAFDTDNVKGFATGCTVPGGHVCAGADEIEAPFINGDIERESMALDEALLAKWDARAFVSVWDNGATKKPLAGARLEMAPGDGEVIYIDPPPAGSLIPIKRTDNATGPSGLAVVFSNRLSTVKVTTSTGGTRDITVATPDWGVGAAMVVMP